MFNWRILILIGLSQILTAGEVTSISDVKIFIKDVNPTKMTSSMNVTANTKNFADAKDALESIIKTVKLNKEICQVENSQITPKYIYDNRKQKQDGYIVRIGIACEFVDANQYDKALGAIYATSTSLNAQIGVSSITWATTQEQIDNAMDDLKQKALVYGQNEARALSKALNLTCIAKAIKFNAVNDTYKPAVRAHMAADSLAPTEAPELKEQKIRLSSEYVWSCGY